MDDDVAKKGEYPPENGHRAIDQKKVWKVDDDVAKKGGPQKMLGIGLKYRSTNQNGVEGGSWCGEKWRVPS